MKKVLIVMPALLLAFCATSAQTLELKWKTDTVLQVPESVLFDREGNVLYVSNIVGKSDAKDGNGYISKLSPDGKIVSLKWSDQGLHAPKGMGLYKGEIFVADLTGVAIIDVKTGKNIERIEINDAQFLNDITIDKNGDVYVSDSATGKIHRIRNRKAELYFDGNGTLKRVNGLLALPDGLYVADAGTGINYKLGADKQLTKYAETAPGADGIVLTGKNEYIVSSWSGEVYYVATDGKAQKLLDTKGQKLNSADIDYDPKTGTVFIPTFFGNSVMAYKFKK
jgi:sugar lactone lactonase YvrE